MKYLKGYINYIAEKQVIDPDYFDGGSENIFKEDELEPIDKVISTFMKDGIYVFKLNDDRLFKLTDFLNSKNIQYGETSQLGSDITVYDSVKFPKFNR